MRLQEIIEKNKPLKLWRCWWANPMGDGAAIVRAKSPEDACKFLELKDYRKKHSEQKKSNQTRLFY